MFSKSISGSFAREANGNPTLWASAIVSETEHGVSLAVPAGNVAGAMTRGTATAIGTALIEAAGGEAPKPAEPSNSFGLVFVDAGDGYIDVRDETGETVVTLAPRRGYEVVTE